MKNNKNTTIVLLSITATLLLTVLLLTMSNEPAVAAQAESRGSSYTVAVARATSTQDLLYVIDTATAQMNTYTVDKDTRKTEILLVTGPFDLQQLMRSAESGRNPGR